ncbi:MAG TPA: Type 1 glutamine amidotransferase-like domain-containing protein [Armatimonadota bacterium]|nr:Type 1 glutamine amidotransferase-like domain-containing protein [Armatimonadota bacterium]
MGKIVAIGGGGIGQEGREIETLAIDREIIRLSGRKRPQLLFIPTASSDAEGYVEAVEAHFGARLGCSVETLRLLGDPPSHGGIAAMIRRADIVYVGGGNTLKMMNRWRRLGVHQLLRKAHASGTVLSGLSAGAICWFRYGCSDSRKFANPEAALIRVTGLRLHDLLMCPHYDSEGDRKAGFRALMKRTPGVGLALDDCAALVIEDDQWRVMSCRDGVKGYRGWWSRGEWHIEEAVDGTLAELVRANT